MDPQFGHCTPRGSLDRCYCYGAADSIRTIVSEVRRTDQSVGSGTSQSIPEILVSYDDGFFAMREVHLIGNGIPYFKAKAYNGLGHDWDSPVFSITYEGHDHRDQSKRIRQSFVVQGLCSIPFSAYALPR
jgi:hypothetical protein